LLDPELLELLDLAPLELELLELLELELLEVEPPELLLEVLLEVPPLEPELLELGSVGSLSATVAVAGEPMLASPLTDVIVM
jgi:hypothetical protein